MFRNIELKRSKTANAVKFPGTNVKIFEYQNVNMSLEKNVEMFPGKNVIQFHMKNVMKIIVEFPGLEEYQSGLVKIAKESGKLSGIFRVAMKTISYPERLKILILDLLVLSILMGSVMDRIYNKEIRRRRRRNPGNQLIQMQSFLESKLTKICFCPKIFQ
jgi:hypothetical protein